MNDDLLSRLPVAAPWSLIIGPLGKGLVFAGFAFFLVAAILSFVRRANPKIGAAAFILGSISLFGVMACLLSLFIRDQFQYEYVFSHADSNTALQYKIAGVWSGQQGSFLLWGVCSAIFGLLTIGGTGQYRRPYLAVFSLFLAAICGILAYETPFNLIPEVMAHGKVLVPDRGQGLNPTLQNYWVVIHPPVIFLGFGALTVMFAYAVAAMVTGDLRDWISRVRPWSLVAMSILAVGICMGGFWAYETLGWGGFWAWDPVENVSFVPWLVLVAFLHGVIVQTTKGRWLASNLLLAGIPFLLFVYGTFLTRSGLLTEVSVHSFAKMDANALKILLGFLGLSLVFFIGLFFRRGLPLARKEAVPAPEEGMTKEAGYTYGAMLLCMLAIVISIGMSWPVILSLTGNKMAVVEESLYHRVVVWFFIPIMLLMALVPFLSWNRTEPSKLWERTMHSVAGAIFLTGISVFAFKNPVWGIHVQDSTRIPFPFGMQAPLLPWMAFLTFTVMFVLVSNSIRAVQLVKRSKPSVGAFLAHIGLALLMGGLILSRGFERVEKNVILQPGIPARALDFTVAYKDYEAKDQYDRDGKVVLSITGPEGNFEARPGLYYVPDANGDDKGFVSPYISRTFSHDVYLTLHEPRIFIWEEPQWFKPGETKTVNRVTVKYISPTLKGEPGQAGTAFGALVDVTVQEQTYRANPTFTLGKGTSFEPVGDELMIVMPQMNAADKSVALQVLFARPVYALDLYYKPLTSLVWGGTGILFLGGMISAFYRRRRAVGRYEQADASV